MSDYFDTPEEDIDAKLTVNYENESGYLEDEKDVETFVKAIEAAEREGVLETAKPQGIRNHDWKEAAGVLYDEEEQTFGSSMDAEIPVITEDYKELKNFTRGTELYIEWSSEWE